MNRVERLNTNAIRLAIAAHVLIAVAELTVGFYVDAMSLISEAVHSSIDVIAALVAFWAIRRSAKLPDENYVYGHGKTENISAAVEALLVISAGTGILFESYGRMNAKSVQESIEYGAYIMAGAIVVNLAVSYWLMRVARRTGSQALLAEAYHIRSDIWTSAGVLAGIVTMKLTGWAWLDLVIAVVIAGILFKTGVGLLMSTTNELNDISLPHEVTGRLEEIINGCKYVRGCHCLRTRKSGNYRMMDVHVLFDNECSIEVAHAVCECLEDRIRHEFGVFDIVIHEEPYRGHIPESLKLQFALSAQNMNDV